MDQAISRVPPGTYAVSFAGRKTGGRAPHLDLPWGTGTNRVVVVGIIAAC